VGLPVSQVEHDVGLPVSKSQQSLAKPHSYNFPFYLSQKTIHSTVIDSALFYVFM